MSFKNLKELQQKTPAILAMLEAIEGITLKDFEDKHVRVRADGALTVGKSGLLAEYIIEGFRQAGNTRQFKRLLSEYEKIGKQQLRKQKKTRKAA